MKIYLASDHAGFELKHILRDYLAGLGQEVTDLGPGTLDPSDDYPDYILPLAHAVAADPGSYGIVIGGSGEGEAMAANRVEGVRAAEYYGPSSHKTEGQADPFAIIRLSREHNDANVLSLGARFLSPDEAKKVAQIWLETPFSGDERHVRRIQKLDI